MTDETTDDTKVTMMIRLDVENYTKLLAYARASDRSATKQLKVILQDYFKSQEA